MLNLIRADLYRLFRTKSVYVIWVMMAVIILLVTSVSASYMGMEYIEEDTAVQSEQSVSVSASVSVDSSVIAEMEEFTVYELFYEMSSCGLFAMLMVIFAVIYSLADIGSGYIKNVGGQVSYRGRLIVSRAVALAVYTLLTLVGVCLVQAASNRLCLGYLSWGDRKGYMTYFMTVLVLHYALVVICMAVAVVSRNKVISIIWAIALSGGFMMLPQNLVNFFIHKLGAVEFDISRYDVEKWLVDLPINPTGSECGAALALAAVYIVAMVGGSSIIFQKRDI